MPSNATVPLYRQGEINRCPGCGRTQWRVGRITAECAFCGTALQIATRAVECMAVAA
jgi:hypothetical protein